ncbi:acetyl-CoA carboxylase biotin carboxyl carrier protein [Bacillus shivajii]|uniref:acetyl-CoA carboxylase biotin carboxyl carrier protein n=1 Tax=Bacillus shivajii TaxID=1983719 RepID=UPI001CFB903C|nr:acetyl-CoA carboxylase biotin carboxyl carrier protein [Bacillus shivajii]UCZ54606.1 acetyl-CoA carboxylase biotin carboxyl carrier protein [Bacillus shivajii]
MLKIQEIRELIKLIDQSSINEFKFEQNGSKVTMRKDIKGNAQVEPTQPVQNMQPVQESTQIVPAANPVVQEQVKSEPETKVTQEKSDEKPVEQDRSGLHTITSPMVGTFYAAPSPDSAPYVKVGDKVKTDSVVCIVEAMKLMNEIEAEVNGEIVEILVENGQLVEYGQEMFLVKPE